MLPTIRPSGCNYRCQIWTKNSLCGPPTNLNLNSLQSESDRGEFQVNVCWRGSPEVFCWRVFSQCVRFILLSIFFFHSIVSFFSALPHYLRFHNGWQPLQCNFIFPFFISSSGVQNTAGCPSTILETKKWWPTTNQESCVMVAVSWPNQRTSDDSNKLKTTYPLNASLRTPSCCSSSFKLTLCILHIKIKWGHKELT